MRKMLWLGLAGIVSMSAAGIGQAAPVGAAALLDCRGGRGSRSGVARVRHRRGAAGEAG